MRPALFVIAVLFLVSCASAPRSSAPAPAPGDADFPTQEASARHAEKVSQVKTGRYDLVLIGDSYRTRTRPELKLGRKPSNPRWQS